MVAAILLYPRIGAVLAVGLIITGQMLVSLTRPLARGEEAAAGGEIVVPERPCTLPSQYCDRAGVEAPTAMPATIAAANAETAVFPNMPSPPRFGPTSCASDADARRPSSRAVAAVNTLAVKENLPSRAGRQALKV